ECNLKLVVADTEGERMSQFGLLNWNRKISFAFVLGLATQLSTQMCLAEKQGKTLVFCSEGSPSSFDPATVDDGTSVTAAAHTIFNRLVSFKIGTTEIIPSLAESWKISSDGKTYTFKLRKGVKFHSNEQFKPTRDLNADDVIFSLMRQLDKNHPFTNSEKGFPYFEGMEMNKTVAGAKAIDPNTVQFELIRPDATFLANMAMSFMSIHSKEYADFLLKENRKQDLGLKPIGTGPFVFQSYSKDNLIKYKAFEQYWGKTGNISKLIFAITPDPTVRYQKLKAGECQIISQPAPADIPAMKKDHDLTVIQAPGLNVGYLAMNVKKKPFDNILVRQAINYALNKRSYVDAIYFGTAVIAKNPIPNTLWSYNESTRDYDYDIRKAKELLAKAGFRNGFETEIWTLPVSRPYNPDGKKMGEMMAADLEKIGIKVTLKTFDWPTFLEKSKHAEHSMIQFGWTSDNGDPDNFMYILLSCAAAESGSNVANWCYQPFDDLVEKARRTTDQKVRTKFYRDAQLIFKDQAPWVPIAHSVVFKAMSHKVKNFKIDPLGGNIFQEVTIE
ncbi:MAG TPA: ABC transporter substrate-binding protein, partial [Pseudobdellovibrionaceae bacterium]|nr:ABC transporter substrate-binding protein [Pseudobdellovibrionaceae bacterium]